VPGRVAAPFRSYFQPHGRGDFSAAALPAPAFAGALFYTVNWLRFLESFVDLQAPAPVLVVGVQPSVTENMLRVITYCL